MADIPSLSALDLALFVVKSRERMSQVGPLAILKRAYLGLEAAMPDIARLAEFTSQAFDELTATAQAGSSNRRPRRPLPNRNNAGFDSPARRLR